MYLDTGNKSECTGCTACKEICGHSAITMVEDSEGFFYPMIDMTSCIDCGLCRKVCPVAGPAYINTEKPDVYVNCLKSENDRKKSSSGGLFYAIAKFVISQNGIVVGAAFDGNLKLRHKAATTSAELENLRGSKYVQSNLHDIFKDIRKYLREGRFVYFVGTPCQVAGLKSLLIKKYDNLLTSDLVCHGVPSQKMLDWHIAYREAQFNDKILNIQFRDNEKWGVCEICDFATRKQFRSYSYQFSPYLFPFMYGYNYRPACYECPFAKVPRQGDITLGDFWGAKEYFPNFDASHGASAAIINSELGERIWDEIKSDLNWDTSTIQDVASQNKNIIQSTNRPKVRDGIYERITNVGYANMAKTEFRIRFYHLKRLRYYLSSHLKLGRIKRYLSK